MKIASYAIWDISFYPVWFKYIYTWIKYIRCVSWTMMALGVFLLTGCATWSLKLAPPSPYLPTHPSSTGPAHGSSSSEREEAYSLASRRTKPRKLTRPSIDLHHVYTLTELIDLAERSHPDTRITWEKARQAALAVGIAWSEYWPRLSATVLGGYQRVNYPLPIALGSKTYFGVDAFELIPSLALRWLVFDFGSRAAILNSTLQLSKAANALFTAAHQKIIFDVAKAFFKFNALHSQVAVSEEVLEHAKRIAKAVDSRRNRGLATIIESTHAHHDVVQAEYNLAQAQSLEESSYAGLLAAVGVDPLSEIHVESNTSHPLPQGIEKQIDHYLQSALRTRPDIQAALARVRAAKAKVSGAYSAFFPKLVTLGTLGYETRGARIDGSPFFEQSMLASTFWLQLDWRIFDAGSRQAELRLSESQQAEAESTLEKAEDQAIRQVIIAYNEVLTGLKRYRAAESLATSADVAADAAAEAYKDGVGTSTAEFKAQSARAQAHATKEEAYAEVLTAVTTLAFASGQLTSGDVLTPLDSGRKIK